MNITGYKHVNYKELQTELHKKNADADIHELKLAAAVDVKSVATVRNAFNTDNQVASDEVMSRLFTALNLEALIIWINGERNYYIKSKSK